MLSLPNELGGIQILGLRVFSYFLLCRFFILYCIIGVVAMVGNWIRGRLRYMKIPLFICTLDTWDGWWFRHGLFCSLIIFKQRAARRYPKRHTIRALYITLFVFLSEWMIEKAML